MSLVLGRPPRAPRSHPVNPGAQAPGFGKGTTASAKPTAAPRATGPDEARRTTRGHKARQRVKLRDRCQATTATGCRKPGQRAQHAANHGTETGARQHQNRTPQTPARSGGVQAGRAHGHKHTPTSQPAVAERNQNPSPSTHIHTARPSQEWRGTSGARTQTRTPQHPSQEWRGAAETRAQAPTPTPHTQARSGEVQAERAQTNTHTPTREPGVAGRSQNPSPSTHTHTAHPSQEWRGTGKAHSQAYTHPITPARSGGAQPKPEPKHTHPHRTPRQGVAGYKRGARTQTQTPQHPSEEWRGAAETRAQAHTPAPHTRPRRGVVQVESAHKHTHIPTPQPGEAGRTQTRAQGYTHTPHTRAWCGGVQAERTQHHTQTPTPKPGVTGRSRNPSPSTHKHTAHPSQEWRATSRERAHKHTHPNTPARSGGAQPKAEHKHTHPHRTPDPGEAWYKWRAHTNTHTPQHPSQEWRGAAKTRAQAQTPTPHSPARSGGVQAGCAHKHTQTPTPQPGVAGRSQNPTPDTHMHTAHPSQEWRGTSGGHAQTHTHPITPSQEWRGAAETPAQAQPGPKHKRHTTVGTPMSIARALRQPVPCR